MLEDQNKTKEVLIEELDYLRKKISENQMVDFDYTQGYFQNLPVPLYRNTGDGQGHFIKANTALAQMFGYSLDEFMKVKVSDLYLNPQERQKFVDAVREEGGVVFNKELRLKRKDGTIIWASCSAKASFDEAGKIKWLDGVIEDITERKSSEELLKENEERLKLALSGANLGTWDWNIQTNQVKYDWRWAEMLGYSLDEITPDLSAWEKLVHPDDLVLTQKKIKSHFEGETSFFQAKYRMRHKSGEWVWVSDQGKLIAWDNQGKALRACGTHLDITEQIRFEDELKKQEKYLASIINALGDPLFVKNQKHQWVLLNDAFCEFMGVKKDDLIGKTDYDFFPSEEAAVFFEKDEEVFKNGQENLNEEQFTDSAGVTHTILTKKTLYVDDNGQRFIVGMIRDITKRKSMEQALESSLVDLKASQKDLALKNEDLTKNEDALKEALADLKKTHQELKEAQTQSIQSQKMADVGQLSAGVAHEIKNPLAIIELSISVLERRDYISQGQDKDKIQMMKDAIERANKIVKELLYFSRSSSMVLSRVELNEVIFSALGLISNSAKINDIAVVRTGENIDKLSVEADFIFLEQVFFNVLSNAIDAIGRGGKITICTKVKEIDKSKKIIIEISDTGCGIAEDKLSRIFEPFYTTKEPGKGTGLGLSTVYRLLEFHQGTISVKSKEGQGSIVSITLPLI
ncbi:MAG: PAS domain S-box protein [Candidatus Omnitrophica bacterium]|nr:PAS domain S-box protein [Candidatus Omnitrophota bacterium]